MIVYSNSDSYGVLSDIKGQVYSKFIAEHFNATLINSGKPGSCNDRIFRTTVRDLLELTTNNKEEILVLISIATSYRFEYWSNTADKNDGHFKSELFWDPSVDTKNLSKELLLLYNEDAEITKLYCNLVLLTTFLKSLGVKYLIWSGSNTYKNIDFQAPFVNNFFKMIQNDKNVIPFDKFNFCSYCLGNNHVPYDYDLYKDHGHHGASAHKDFANYLIENYLNEISVRH